MAAQMLSGRGFKQVFNVAGGIKAWQAETAVGPQDLGVHLFDGRQGPAEVLKVAYSLEDGLREFYLSLADKAGNPQVSSLFLKLSKIEVKHQESIIKAYEELGQGTAKGFKDQVQEKALEGGMTTEEYLGRFGSDLSSPVDVVSMAMSIEAQALDLYLRAGAGLKDEGARQIVLKIAQEEKEHLASLGRLMEAL